jgi:hypothetical protein
MMPKYFSASRTDPGCHEIADFAKEAHGLEPVRRTDFGWRLHLVGGSL